MFDDFEFEEKFNPWDVKSVEEFRFYCCPECSTRNVHKSDFIRHALTFHPKSKIIFEKSEDNKDDVKPIVTEAATSKTITENVSNEPTSFSNNSSTESKSVDDVIVETEQKGTVTLCYTSDDSSDSSDDEDTSILQPTKDLSQNISPSKSTNDHPSNLSNNHELQENITQNASNSEVQTQLLKESLINNLNPVNQDQPTTSQTLMANTNCCAASNPVTLVQNQSEDQITSPAKRSRSDLDQSTNGKREVPPGYVLYSISKATNHRLMTQPFMCEFCYQHFTTFDEATIHLSLFHPQEVKMCGIITQSGIDQSVPIHKCQDCQQVCIEVTKLRIHRWLQHSELN